MEDRDMTQRILRKGTRAVSISVYTPSRVEARLYVNCTPAALGDATLTAGKFGTLRGAIRWAAKTLAS
jgi:hypothetical protein